MEKEGPTWTKSGIATPSLRGGTESQNASVVGRIENIMCCTQFPVLLNNSIGTHIMTGKAKLWCNLWELSLESLFENYLWELSFKTFFENLSGNYPWGLSLRTLFVRSVCAWELNFWNCLWELSLPTLSLRTLFDNSLCNCIWELSLAFLFRSCFQNWLR